MQAARAGAGVLTGAGFFAVAGPAVLAEERPQLVVPRVNHPPSIEEFLDMDGSAGNGGGLARFEGFIQRQPNDGSPMSRRTVFHLGYDSDNLYAVFQAFDDPQLVRGNLTRRDEALDDNNDDQVCLWLDTFDDRRRAYYLGVNPAGVQYDALYSEGGPINGDKTFDMVWQSSATRTDQGFVVLLSVPFRSLRFSDAPQQKFGVLAERWIGRHAEWGFWPRVALGVQGFLSQAVEVSGLEKISPGRNIQVVPYATFRASRELDADSGANAGFVSDPAEPDAGVDAKFVIRDKLVLDLTGNPEFSQVESDSPQVTVNQRFEVLFPEKRPFFLENSDYFETPIRLVFTRRIADPRAGARLTGKAGSYALGALVSDDESPGRNLPPDDPLEGKRATFGILRLRRDVLSQSSLGVIYTERQLESGFNRVGGMDGRLRLNDHWTTSFQAVASSSRLLDGTGLSGPGYHVSLGRSDRNFNYLAEYDDFSPGFRTDIGFVNRIDIRSLAQNVNAFFFRPKDSRIQWVRPDLYLEHVEDHDGLRLDQVIKPGLQIRFARVTQIDLFHSSARERLRAQDFADLPDDRDYHPVTRGVSFMSRPANAFSAAGELTWGTGINFVPQEGALPSLGDLTSASLSLTLRPPGPLRIDATLLSTRLSDRESGTEIFTDRIVRTRWNWQFNGEVSLRAIVEYDATRVNPQLTSLERRRNLNGDLLFTRQVNPWTALYVGINGNAQNVEFVDTPAGNEVVRTRNDLLNDSRQFFVKYSYRFGF